MTADAAPAEHAARLGARADQVALCWTSTAPCPDRPRPGGGERSRRELEGKDRSQVRSPMHMGTLDRLIEEGGDGPGGDRVGDQGAVLGRLRVERRANGEASSVMATPSVAEQRALEAALWRRQPCGVGLALGAVGGSGGHASGAVFASTGGALSSHVVVRLSRLATRTPCADVDDRPRRAAWDNDHGLGRQDAHPSPPAYPTCRWPPAGVANTSLTRWCLTFPTSSRPGPNSRC